MIVFSKEWLHTLDVRYRNHARYEKPNIYYYATDEYYENLRNEIEDWVIKLPEKTLASIIPRLQSEEHFLQTYNELTTNHILNQLGYKTEYEKDFLVNDRSITPDWYAIRDNVKLIVEVVTINPSIESRQEREKIGHLYSRLRSIPSNAVVKMHHSDNFSADQVQTKYIVEEVTKWLRTEHLATKTSLVLNDIQFEFLKAGGNTQLHIIFPATVFSINPQDTADSLRRKIFAKAKKYKYLNEPLIVSVLPNFYAHVDIEDIKNALWGQEKWLLSDTVEKETASIREPDGLFMDKGTTSEALSGIMWIPKHLGIPLELPKIGVFPNPRSSKPISRNDLKASSDNSR